MNNKLLFFASDYKIGLSVLLTQELKALNKQQGLQLLSIAGENEQEKGLTSQLNDCNIPIIRIEGLDCHRNFRTLANRVNEITKSFEFSFVHVQNNWQLALMVFIKYVYKRNFKIIYTIHGYRHNSFFKAIVAKRLIDISLYFFANVIFAPSTFVKRKFWLIRKKCHVLYLGVEENYLSHPRPNLYSEHKNIIFGGQFRQGKNQCLILDALAIYVNKTGNRNFTLYLPGEGELKKKCVEQAKSLNLINNIEFPGHLSRSAIFRLYTQCQIAIIPSNSETFGHCIAEPFALGLCVMTRNVGIANDIIINEQNGFLFKDADSLASLLERFINQNDKLNSIANSALDSKNLFNWSTISDGYMRILNNYSKTKSTEKNLRETNANLLFFASDYKIGLSATLSDQAKSINSITNINLICVCGSNEQEIGLRKKYENFKIPLIQIEGLDEHRKFIRLVKILEKLISFHHIDKVHIHNNWQLALVVYIRYFYGYDFKIIYSIHGYRHNNILKSILAKNIIGISLYMFADMVLAGSTELRKAIPFIHKKCYLLIQGVEDDLFNVEHNEKSGRHLNLVFAGQFRKGKNQKKLIDTLKDYSNSTGNFDYTLYLPGEGKLLKSCKSHALNIGLDEHVVFPGQLTRIQIKQLYEKCQVAIIPSNTETFGYCIAEPFISGLCVISRKTGIALDIIEHKKTGLLFDSFSELKKLLITYMEDDQFIELLSQNAFLNRDILRWVNITETYKSLLNKLMN